MNAYTPPLREMLLSMQVADRLVPYDGASSSDVSKQEFVEPILSAAARLAVDVFAPLQRRGDIEGVGLESGRPRFPDGFKEAYEHYVQGGWSALPYDAAIGGQGLPYPIATAVSEMWGSAATVLGLLFMPVGGAITLLSRFGSTEQRRICLPKLVSGEWLATMAMTEPQAGTDLGAIRCRAIPKDGKYALFGEKTFISFADHDLTDNVLQFVLARTPDSPPGVRGLTLFLVPTVRMAGDGRLASRNDVRYLRLERKLGLHAMPTGTLLYGESGGAEGYRIGEEHRGLECMFALMNRARLSIGLLGLANAERAFQAARRYARERVQGRPAGTTRAEALPIAYHADVRRMLFSMKARVEAMRLLAYFTANLIESAERARDPERRKLSQARLDLMTPVVKAWLTETGFQVVSTAMQVHGGFGYMEESGLPQLLREARVHAIYEGTTGVQATDFVGRKIARDEGATARRLLQDLSSIAGPLRGSPNADLRRCEPMLTAATRTFERATAWIVEQYARDPQRALAGSVPYLEFFASVSSSWLMAQGALMAEDARGSDHDAAGFARAKSATARFFADYFLSDGDGRLLAITQGGDVIAESALDWI